MMWDAAEKTVTWWDVAMVGGAVVVMLLVILFFTRAKREPVIIPPKKTRPKNMEFPWRPVIVVAKNHVHAVRFCNQMGYLWQRVNCYGNRRPAIIVTNLDQALRCAGLVILEEDLVVISLPERDTDKIMAYLKTRIRWWDGMFDTRPKPLPTNYMKGATN